MSNLPNRAVVIIVAGMYRSGSTWMFNCVRNTLIALDIPFHQSGNCDQDGWNRTDMPVIIAKAHEYVHAAAEEADLVLTSRRILIDSVNSWNRFRPDQPKGLQEASDWIAHLERWREGRHHKYCMSYNAFDELNCNKNVATIIEHVYSAICKLDAFNNKHKHYSMEFGAKLLSEVIKLNQETKPPEERDYDPGTYYFSNHITSPRT